MQTRTDLAAAVQRINLEFKYDHLGRCIMKQDKEGATVLETRYCVWNGWHENLRKTWWTTPPHVGVAIKKEIFNELDL